MGRPKALLRDADGRTFVSRIAASLRAAGLERVVVVTGYHHDDIVDTLRTEPAGAPVQVVRNSVPARGQLSSLWAAMDEVCGPEIDALVVTLVDVPMVAPATIRAVVEAWRRTRAPIVRPAVGVRRGHPVVFDRSVFGELRKAPLDAGARVVVRAHMAEIVEVPVDDPGCIRDVDTPDDYRTLLQPDPGVRHP
jgi:CTP:molybdopterin cytidylyltransferase MocA